VIRTKTLKLKDAKLGPVNVQVMTESNPLLVVFCTKTLESKDAKLGLVNLNIKVDCIAFSR
jgi:hypothetical protein